MSESAEHKNNKQSKAKDGGKSESESSSTSTYDKASKVGESIGDAITSGWNSQEEPGKAYVKNRRVHHGEVGTAMGVSSEFKDSEPTITGAISGIGKGLVKDDIADKEKWFTFKKKDEERGEEEEEKKQNKA